MPAKSNSGHSSSSSGIPIRTRKGDKNNGMFSDHLSLLNPSTGRAQQQDQEIANAPLFTVSGLSSISKSHLLESQKSPYTQHGLIGGLSDVLDQEQLSGSQDRRDQKDPRVFFNTTGPSSTFICGSQGSGKSHTLSCLLENCMIPSIASKLPNPLTGIVFHYDTFISDDGGSPCEAAFLASNPKIQVRVLCSPTNFHTIKVSVLLGYECRRLTILIRGHNHFLENVTVEPLLIGQGDLNTKRMLDLMAVSSEDGRLPLYLHSVYRVLREMRMDQQEHGDTFNYSQFKSKILSSGLSPHQLAPLEQRLDTLESFMPKSQTTQVGRKKKKNEQKGANWTPEAGLLTIVDLSCPCVTPEGACALFNICLSIFMEQSPKIGRVIALDEAHKFINSSAEADALTSTLLSVIRLQRHLAARIIISTQEPTISPRLLDLCSVTVVHRFTSPDWLRILQRHIAGASASVDSSTADSDEEASSTGKDEVPRDLFKEIVALRVGQALVFSPSSIVGWQMVENGRDITSVKKLASDFLKLQIRSRITEDGGKSLMSA